MADIYKELNNYWDSEVKPLAKACVDSEVVNMFIEVGAASDGSFSDSSIPSAFLETEEGRNKVIELVEKHSDVLAIWHISSFIASMENDIADNRDYAIAISSALGLKKILSSERYWGNEIWANPKSKEEKERLIKFRNALPKLIGLINIQCNYR